MEQQTDSIVSLEGELLILVNPEDQETGNLSKAECHDGDGVLHRAFSVFLFNARGELLLQQRSAAKRLWPMFWTNTCCSHPRQGESLELATSRRLYQELGISSKLEFVYKFSYQARFSDQGSENELCSVYLGRLEQPAIANKVEIAELRYLSSAALDKEIAANAERFTPWLKMEWHHLKEEFPDRLAVYTKPR